MAQINTPKEVLALAQQSATGKMQLPAGKTLLLAFLAGAYIAMGGLFSLMAIFIGLKLLRSEINRIFVR